MELKDFSKSFKVCLSSLFNIWMNPKSFILVYDFHANQNSQSAVLEVKGDSRTLI